MKKKLIALTVIAALLVVGIAGASLAYFTDTDEANNVFTVGNVQIDLVEEFDSENAILLPGDENTNTVNKDAWVDNTGANDAWVRIKVYVPAALSAQILHIDLAADADVLWNAALAEENAVAVSDTDSPYFGCVEYTYYYNEILAAGETTQQLLDQVYLDSAVDVDVDEDGSYVWSFDEEIIDYPLEDGVSIIVIAEAIQADGFTTWADAFAAFDAQS